MHRVLVLGAGKIGSLIAGLLADAGDYHVQLADQSGDKAVSARMVVEGKAGRQRSLAGA